MKIKTLIKDLRSGTYGQPDNEIVVDITTPADIASFVEENGLLPDELLARAKSVGMGYDACMTNIMFQFEHKVDSFFNERASMAVERFTWLVGNLERERQEQPQRKAKTKTISA
jgi:hypothetical protein